MEETRRLAKVIMSSYGLMGYDAINLSYRDFKALGAEGVKAISTLSPPLLLSTNLNIPSDKPLPVKKNAILETGDLKVGIISVSEGSKEIHGFKYEEPLAILEKAVDGIKKGKGVDLLIVLSSAGLDINRSMRRKIDGVDFILSAKSLLENERVISNRTPSIVMTGGSGKYIGKLYITGLKLAGDRFERSKRMERYLDEEASLKNSIERLKDFKSITNDPDTDKKIEHFENLLKGLHARMQKEVSGKRVFYFKEVLIRSEKGEDEKIQRLIQRYKRGE